MDSDSNSDSEEEEFDRRKRAACAAVMAACMAIIPVLRKERDREEEYHAGNHDSESIPPDIARDSKRERYIRKIIRSTDRTCIDMTRMNKASFHHLCRVLRSRGLLRDTLYVSVEEQLVMFLNTVGHGMSNRIISRNFARSGETVSRYFNIVLKAIGSLKDDYIRGPPPSPPPEITSDTRYWPWFKVINKQRSSQTACLCIMTNQTIIISGLHWSNRWNSSACICAGRDPIQIPGAGGAAHAEHTGGGQLRPNFLIRVGRLGRICRRLKNPKRRIGERKWAHSS